MELSFIDLGNGSLDFDRKRFLFSFGDVWPHHSILFQGYMCTFFGDNVIFRLSWETLIAGCSNWSISLLLQIDFCMGLANVSRVFFLISLLTVEATDVA